MSQVERKQHHVMESSDETNLTTGNSLICHVALSVDRKKKEEGEKNGRRSSAQFKSGPV